MADGKTCDEVMSIILRADTDDGVSGWGEMCAIPHYLPAFAGGVAPALKEMAPVLLGANPVGPEAVMTKLDAHLPGHGYAKSALDIALWDITAQVANMPLYALLGGRQAKDLPLYHSITCVAPEEMARIAVEAKKEGILQFQVKLGADKSEEADIARLRLVRESVGSGMLVYGDWNCGASRLHATQAPFKTPSQTYGTLSYRVKKLNKTDFSSLLTRNFYYLNHHLIFASLRAFFVSANAFSALSAARFAAASVEAAARCISRCV